MGRACSQNGRSKSAFKILTGKPTENSPLVRPRRRCEDNIRMNLNKIGSVLGIGMIELRVGIIGKLL